MRNFFAEMLNALTSAYTRKDCDSCKLKQPIETNIGKLFSVLSWGLNSVQEQAELIKLWDNIDYAHGSVLDRYGANFGVKRMSSDDNMYRLAIRIKVIAQLSGGDINTVVRAASALLDVEPTDILLEEIYPAKISLYVNWNLLPQMCKDSIESIAYSLKRILAAGVGMRLYVRTYRVSRLEIPITNFALNNTHLVGPPPDIHTITTVRPRVSGGVIYHTRIKSKRID